MPAPAWRQYRPNQSYALSQVLRLWAKKRTFAEAFRDDGTMYCIALGQAHVFASQDTMNERIVIIDNVDPVIFYGVNNQNMHLLRNLYPKLRIAARGSVIKAIGEESETADFEEKVKALAEFAERYNRLTEETIIDTVKGEAPKEISHDDAIIFGINGKPIQARTPNQKRLVDAFCNNDLTFAMGPAGTGKTYIAIALAVRALKNRQVRKIILSRPAVEAGEKLGFLPGDMKDKIDPYLQPLYDALEDMIPTAKLKEYMEAKVIQIAPLAFMRGRTLNDAVIILDEAQNTTTHQIKMFMTRLGLDAKMIITGDVTQIDLPRATASGLVQALRILDGVKGVGRVEFDKHDIVRHQLVQRIVEAYERHDAQEKAAALAAREAAQEATEDNVDTI